MTSDTTNDTSPLDKLSTPVVDDSTEYRVLYDYLHATCAGEGGRAIAAVLGRLEQEVARVREALGLKSPCRHVLYDFDADTLVGGLYRDYQEALADAARLDNVMVLDMPWPEDEPADPVEVLITVPADTTPQHIKELETALGQTAVNVTPVAGNLDVLFMCPDEPAAESLADRAEALALVQSVCIGS